MSVANVLDIVPKIDPSIMQMMGHIGTKRTAQQEPRADIFSLYFMKEKELIVVFLTKISVASLQQELLVVSSKDEDYDKTDAV